MTDEEKQEIIEEVLAALKTNGKTIEQLTVVTTMTDTDKFELSGGRYVTYAVLQDDVTEDVATAAAKAQNTADAAATAANNAQSNADTALQAADEAATAAAKAQNTADAATKALDGKLDNTTDTLEGVLTATDGVAVNAELLEMDYPQKLSGVEYAQDNTSSGAAKLTVAMAVSGHLIPASDSKQDLGGTSNRWSYVNAVNINAKSINLDGAKLTYDSSAGVLTISAGSKKLELTLE